MLSQSRQIAESLHDSECPDCAGKVTLMTRYSEQRRRTWSVWGLVIEDLKIFEFVTEMYQNNFTRCDRRATACCKRK